jgi:glycosyltransferase involved in cell wall biosynthesis
MKVVIAAGGRFHALHLAHQLEKRDALKKLFTFSYTSSDKNYISSNLVCNHNFNKYLDFIFSKSRVCKFVNKSKFYVFKDNLFDSWLSKKMKDIGFVDIFIGWTHYFFKSLPEIRKTGAKIIAESGSCHILEQAKLLQEEYDKFGLSGPAINKKNTLKMLNEYEQADYIMTISDFVYKSFIKQGFPEKKLLKATCGIDVEYYLNSENLLRQTQDERCFRDNKFRVICVGLLSLRKGIPYLLQAWNKLNLPEKDTELLLVGNMQQDLKNVLKQIKYPKNVNFYGSTNRATLAKLYQSSSAFVLPSIEDGFGMVIGEAMASGLPVICSTNTAGSDLIEDGKQGFIFKARDVDALSEKILWCYEHKDEAKKMGELGQERVKRFSWDNYGERVFEVYQGVLGN